MNLSKIFKRDPKKFEALTIANQSAAAYDYAARKGGNSVSGRGKRPARTEPREKRTPYEPGKLGLSAVSESILTKEIVMAPRRMRREHSRFLEIPFQKHYNGEGPVRDKGYKRKPSKYAKRKASKHA
jgi:hypothetical protein